MEISLVIILVAALVTPVALAKFKINLLPTAVAEIMVGIILGPSGFNIITLNSSLKELADLGVMLLLFLSGMEIDFSLFKKQPTPTTPLAQKQHQQAKEQPSPLKIALWGYASVLLASVIMAVLFWWLGWFDNILLAIILFSTIGLGIVIAALKEQELLSQPFGQTLLLIAVLGEIVPMLLLTVYVGVFGEENHNLLLIFLVFLVAAVLFKRFRRFFDFFDRYNKATTQLDIRLAFFFIIVLATLATSVGAENILGAFLAGIVMKLIDPHESTQSKLDAIGYGFFIPIFFIVSGVKLDLRSLISHPEVMLLIPVIFLAFIVTKLGIFPVLNRYYPLRNAWAGTLVSSTTITLVLAVLQVADSLKLITTAQSGDFLLAAILTCLLAPLTFNRLYQASLESEQPTTVTFIGVNLLTLPVAKQLTKQGYQVNLYTDDRENYERYGNLKDVHYLQRLDSQDLIADGILDADILILGHLNYDLNYHLALAAKKYGVKRIISRFENKDIMNPMSNTLNEAGIETFNTLDVNIGALRNVIESPSALRFYDNQDSQIHEIVVLNRRFANVEIRNLPYVEDVIISQILRQGHLMTPHGDFRLKLGDHIIFFGEAQVVPKIKLILGKEN